VTHILRSPTTTMQFPRKNNIDVVVAPRTSTAGRRGTSVGRRAGVRQATGAPPRGKVCRSRAPRARSAA
jgi:hypothetical protein